MKILFSLFFFLVFFQSCSSLDFRSEGRIPVYIGPREGHIKRIKIEGEQHFYLFGSIPSSHKPIYIDKLFFESGYLSAASISIEVYQTIPSILKSIFSFGMYIPKHYRIHGWGVNNEK